MFGFVSKFYNKVKELGYFIYEKFCDLLSYLGIKVTPAHFTPQDKSNYQKFIANFTGKILDILQRPLLPDYLKFNDSVKRHKISSVTNLGSLPPCNNKDFRHQARNILSLIAGYLIDRNKERNPVDRLIGAHKYKLDPFKMVLQLLQDYVLSKFVSIEDKPDELINLDNVIDYLEQLLMIQSVKDNIGFYHLLNKISTEFKTAREMLSQTIEINKLRITVKEISKLFFNHIDDVNILLFNLFHFPRIRGQLLITNLESSSLRLSTYSGFNTWIQKILSFFRTNYTFNQKGCEQLVATAHDILINSFRASALELSIQVAQVFSEDGTSKVFEDRERFEKISSLSRLQINLHKWMVCFKILQSIQRDISLASTGEAQFNIVDYSNVLALILSIINSTNSDYASLLMLKEELQSCKLRQNIGERRCKLITELVGLINNFSVVIDSLRVNVQIAKRCLDERQISGLKPNRYLSQLIKDVNNLQFSPQITFEAVQNYIKTPEGAVFVRESKQRLVCPDTSSDGPSVISYLWGFITTRDQVQLQTPLSQNATGTTFSYKPA